MLKRMVINNFRCYSRETVFDFCKTEYKLLEQNTYGEILKGALFVGDNASGKTTAVQPIKLLLDLLFKDKDINLKEYSCWFSTGDITSLKYEFDIDGHDIDYSFSFAGNIFIKESLNVDNENIIERSNETANLKMGNELTVHDADDSILFLKQTYFNTKFVGNEILRKWFAYLKKSIYIDAYTRKISSYNEKNVGIQYYIEKNGVERLNEFFRKNNFKYSLQYMFQREGGRKRNNVDEDVLIFFERQGIHVPIPFFMESMGNQTLVSILPAIMSVVEDGGILIIDEFSSGLHNKLEELLVKYIMNEGKKTQLFFVSHSTNLLSNSILRPDQIYVVEMIGEDGSRLTRVSDQQPRISQNLERMYLSGVFGGLPEYGVEQG